MSTFADQTDSTKRYVLGHSERELSRLKAQARMIDPITKRFFQAAGVGASMRVLDVGSGAGDVAFLAAERNGALIVVDDERHMRLQAGETVGIRTVRFRTLGCWPVTGAIESDAGDAKRVLAEMIRSSSSERQGRIGDQDAGGSLERQKREGYF